MTFRQIFAILVVTTALAASFIGRASAQATVTVTVDRHTPLMTSSFSLGCTRTERDLDNVQCDPAALASATKLINSTARYMNAHIFGWGEANPEPSPGVYNWKDLDRRMAMIQAAHAIPVITLCGAPDWMKGGVAGQTDWKKLTVAPTADHYADFAKLAVAVAQRYPYVLHFQVWNEFKGLWDQSTNNWDYAAYTDMYNQVYDALKAQNPKIQVGGPYLVIGGTSDPIEPKNMAVLTYWNQHKHGADFFLIDKGLVDYHDHTPYTLDQKLAFTHTFGDVVKQVRAISNLPVWYSEYYISASPANSMPATDVLHASILYHMLLAGTSVALMWQPMEGGNELQGLVTDCRQPGGGQPTPFYHAYLIFAKYFGPGTVIYKSDVSSPDMEVLASKTATLLINKSGQAVDVKMNGHSVPMQPYQVLLVDASGKTLA